MLGRPVAEERLKRRSPGATDAWLDSEPLYIEIEAPSTLVGW